MKLGDVRSLESLREEIPGKNSSENTTEDCFVSAET